MEIKYIYVFTVWFFLNVIGLMLMNLRKDVEKYRNEANFIMSKGTGLHKATYLLMLWIILPFTIPFSIKEFLNQKK